MFMRIETEARVKFIPESDGVERDAKTFEVVCAPSTMISVLQALTHDYPNPDQFSTPISKFTATFPTPDEAKIMRCAGSVYNTMPKTWEEIKENYGTWLASADTKMRDAVSQKAGADGVSAVMGMLPMSTAVTFTLAVPFYAIKQTRTYKDEVDITAEANDVLDKMYDLYHQAAKESDYSKD